MAGGRQHNLLDHLRSSLLSCTSSDASDGRLLERFLIDRDQAAFAALVRRHGAMVLGVCRRVLRDHHLAEDAFQATFIVLVRKAAGLRRRQALGNWLYGVAYHTALKARSMLVRRRSKEQQASMLYPKPSVPDPEPRDWLPLLDQELSGLPDRYRQAIVLCDLEGKSRKEAARLLGWREGTLSGRLARGRMLLARRLARRGVMLSGGALALTVATQTAAAVPHPLLVLTTQAAARVAAGPPAAAGALSPPVASLMEGVLRAMFVSKLKIAALVLTVTAASAGLGILRPGLAAGTDNGDQNQPAQAKTYIARVKAPARQERDVEAKLKTVVSLRFKDAPLRQVLEDLRSATGLNIVLDRPGLRASGISEEQPLSFRSTA